MLKALSKKISLATVSSSLLCLLFTVSVQAQSCSAQSFNWASEWDNEFTNTKYKGLQFPRTSTCISGSNLNDQKINGHFFQQDGHAVFDNDDGDDGRTEVRSQNMLGNHSSFNARFRFEGASLSSRNYTVGQMFGEGDGPIVRIEQLFGDLRAVIRTSPGASTSVYGNQSASLNTWYTYKMVRENNKIKVWINGSEVTPSGGLTLSGFDIAKTYYKAGCYMSNATQSNGCRAKFDTIQYIR
ncbi:polysaccharide lyase family 7 protein [Catenovulum adriaticum]|uniref:Polysaccharide lyase family 7 protein n=1 Tax=Catenovulum adriaticum TaxID=2984846 RepID=A0ABY7AIB4_9ALTE|nr:polysaccharide lyase family 7 protein [Catenovulum sp. TS8]WAJ69204.1 polysaccharide lyase family 7 protein [Catenovulum sp. TS8]